MEARRTTLHTRNSTLRTRWKKALAADSEQRFDAIIHMNAIQKVLLHAMTTSLSTPTKPTLYHAPNFSSCRPLGVLVELGVVAYPSNTGDSLAGNKRKADDDEDTSPGALVQVENVSWDQLKNDPVLTELNPQKRLPFFHDPSSSLSLTESGGMVQYLLEKYDEKHTLYPAPGDETRADFLKLLHFGPATAYHVAVHLLFPPSVEKVFDQKKQEWHNVVVPTYEEALTKYGGPYLLGKTLTAADIVLAYDLVTASAAKCASELFEPHPKLKAYRDMISELSFFKVVYPPEKKED